MTAIRISVIAVSFAMAAMAVPASSLARSSDANRTEISQFSAETLGTALKALEIDSEVVDDGIGPKFLSFTYEGLKLSLFPSGCPKDSVENCVGAFLTASWDPYAGVSRSEMLERINAFDAKYDYADAALYADNSPNLSRYWIADYGMNYGNLRVELESFAIMAGKFASELEQPYIKPEPAMLPIETK